MIIFNRYRENTRQNLTPFQIKNRTQNKRELPQYDNKEHL